MSKRRVFRPYLRKVRRKRPSRRSYDPPETWHEPTGKPLRVIESDPGRGFRHAVTREAVLAFLSVLPSWMTEPVDVVHLATMTRKKLSRPCYGLHWGTAIYLYPVPATLSEWQPFPPTPGQRIETEKCGGRWEYDGDGWVLSWDEESVTRFYLENVLTHELAHAHDTWNHNTRDRERYAEAFVQRHGPRFYKMYLGLMQSARAKEGSRANHHT